MPARRGTARSADERGGRGVRAAARFRAAVDVLEEVLAHLPRDLRRVPALAVEDEATGLVDDALEVGGEGRLLAVGCWLLASGIGLRLALLRSGRRGSEGCPAHAGPGGFVLRAG
jgi:hypothetical protein